MTDEKEGAPMSDKLDRIEARPVDVLPDRVLLTKDERDALVEIARAAQAVIGGEKGVQKRMAILSVNNSQVVDLIAVPEFALAAALARLDTEEGT